MNCSGNYICLPCWENHSRGWQNEDSTLTYNWVLLNAEIPKIIIFLGHRNQIIIFQFLGDVLRTLLCLFLHGFKLRPLLKGEWLKNFEQVNVYVQKAPVKFVLILFRNLYCVFSVFIFKVSRRFREHSFQTLRVCSTNAVKIKSRSSTSCSFYM